MKKWVENPTIACISYWILTLVPDISRLELTSHMSMSVWEPQPLADRFVPP